MTPIEEMGKGKEVKGAFHTKAALEEMGKRKESKRDGSSHSKSTRNRASPARLIKLYKSLSEDQKKMIRETGFGGLLNIACDTIPAEFANWLMKDCFDASSSELRFPGRGTILLTAESVSDILGLPKQGDSVKYELNLDSINQILELYNLEDATTPEISAIVKRVKQNKNADADFLRSWLMVAISTFLCPPTSLNISSRCYTSILDLGNVKNLNWSQFVVDQLKIAAAAMRKKKSVKGCLLVLVVLYADSLMVEDIHIPLSKPRIAAWSRKLLDQVIKLDTNDDGSFGKLRLKPSSKAAAQTPMFFRMDDIRRFVSSKVSAGTSEEKKRKMSGCVSRLCMGLTDVLGSFLEEISQVESSEAGPSQPLEPKAKRARLMPQIQVDEEEEPSEPEFEDEETDDDDEGADDDNNPDDPGQPTAQGPLDGGEDKDDGDNRQDKSPSRSTSKDATKDANLAASSHGGSQDDDVPIGNILKRKLAEVQPVQPPFGRHYSRKLGDAKARHERLQLRPGNDAKDTE